MKKVILGTLLVIGVIGAGFKSISRENNVKAPVKIENKADQKSNESLPKTDIAAKDHTGWD